MSRTQTLVAVVVTVAGCGGGSQLASGQVDAMTSIGQCRRDPSVVDGGPGACGSARAYISCKDPNGGGCGCLTDATACSVCGGAGAACTNKCNANEYAAACGSVGPPDAIPYANPPAGCRLALASPSGATWYCCPCL